MDPLSDALAVFKPRSYISRGFHVAPRSNIRWPAHEGMKCYAVIAGECWLGVEGVAGPAHLTAGDCVLLPPGPPFSMATDPRRPPVDYTTLHAQPQLETAAAATEEAEAAGGCAMFGGHFLLSGRHAGLLLSGLPPVVHLRKESDKAAMRWALERMRAEMREPAPGGDLVAQQLAYMLLVQALRLHIHDAGPGARGWLAALGDRHMGAALAALHADPGRPWTLESLAAHVGMSRSVFALRFRQIVDMTPMEYLTQWRMLLAAERLKNPAESLPGVASALGYASESAFRKAFRRVMGCSPRQSRGGALVAAS